MDAHTAPWLVQTTDPCQRRGRQPHPPEPHHCPASA